MSNIEIIHTSCKNCVFAKYDGKTQTGCVLNYISRYKEIGIEILEAYDNELEFFIVNKKKCHGYRENSWFISNGLSENSSIEEKKQAFYNSNKLSYALVVNFLEIGSTAQDIENLEQRLIELSIKPSKILFIRPQEGGETTVYQTINDLMVKSKINCPWRIQTMVDDSLSNEDILHNAVNHHKGIRFICYLKKSNPNIESVVKAANDIVYQKLETFVVLTDEEKSCYLFSSGVYKYSLLEKQIDILQDPNSFQVI